MCTFDTILGSPLNLSLIVIIANAELLTHAQILILEILIVIKSTESPSRSVHTSAGVYTSNILASKVTYQGFLSKANNFRLGFFVPSSQAEPIILMELNYETQIMFRIIE